jgi:anti-sigma factor RsiW
MRFSIFRKRPPTKPYATESDADMAKCPNDDFMDSYLLGRITDKDREEFEKHYFNCESCFAKVTQRDEIVTLLKDEQVLGVLSEYRVDRRPKRRWWQKLLGVFGRS